MRSANAQWLEVLNTLVNCENIVAPRGKSSRELLGYQTRIQMENPVVTIMSRDLGYRFMCAEAAWILSGDSRVLSIAPFAKAISDFSDDGQLFFGAYGPKIVQQLPYVMRNLKDDLHSRQAVINIWRESPMRSKDIPCTLSLQWIVREGRLHCNATMRSSDVWLGLPYDWFNFSMISAYLLLLMSEIDPYFKGVLLGQLTVTAGSQHLYETNWDAADRLLTQPSEVKHLESFRLKDYNKPQDLIDHLWNRANLRLCKIDFMKELFDASAS